VFYEDVFSSCKKKNDENIVGFHENMGAEKAVDES